MKMLLIVFRESMVEQIHALLAEYQVNAFTELRNVAGRGDTGSTVHFSLMAGANCVILAAVPEQDAYRLIDVLSRFRTEQMKDHGDALVPLHVFLLPCEQVV